MTSFDRPDGKSLPVGHAHADVENPHLVRICATLVATKLSFWLLLARYEAFVFDCDGVLWGGSHSIEGSRE